MKIFLRSNNGSILYYSNQYPWAMLLGASNILAIRAKLIDTGYVSIMIRIYDK